MHRALAMLLAALALLAPLGVAPPAVASPTLASTTRIPDRLGLSQNRIYGNFHSGTTEAEGHSLFLQRDPAGYTDSVNLYAAFANDPVNNRDPTGQVANIAIGAGIGLIGGGLFDLARQLAEMADDPNRTVSLSDLDFARAGKAAAQGAVLGALAGACPVCGVGLASYGATSGVISAGQAASDERYATAAVDGLGAALSAFGGAKLGKGIASKQIAPINPSVSRGATYVAARIRGGRASVPNQPIQWPPNFGFKHATNPKSQLNRGDCTVPQISRHSAAEKSARRRRVSSHAAANISAEAARNCVRRSAGVCQLSDWCGRSSL